MRIDKKYPWQRYENFWEWLSSHPLWIINLLFAYAFYLANTEEI